MSDKLLFIEDDKGQQMAWRMIFEHDGGFEVSLANDGLEGINNLNGEFNVIVLDMSMPNMNGIGFLDEFYKKDKFKKFHHIPIVVLTVWVDLDKVKETCDRYNIMLINKEESGQKVIEKIKKFIEKRNNNYGIQN